MIDYMNFSNIDHYMTEVVSNIELRFGLPVTEEKQEFLNNKAIEFDVSIERAFIIDFESLFANRWMRKDGKNLFELLFLITAGEEVSCQEVTFETYIHNKSRYPKVIIHGDYLDVKESKRRLWVNDEIIQAVGREIENYFEYEFVDFARLKQ